MGVEKYYMHACFAQSKLLFFNGFRTEAYAVGFDAKGEVNLRSQFLHCGAALHLDYLDSAAILGGNSQADILSATTQMIRASKQSRFQSA